MCLFLGYIPTLCTVFNRPSSETVSQASHINQPNIKWCYLASLPKEHVQMPQSADPHHPNAKEE